MKRNLALQNPRMLAPILRTALLVSVVCSAHAQAVDEKRITFEVASLKLASVPSGVSILPGGRVAVSRGSGIEVPRNTGGPGTADPGRIHYPFICLKDLLVEAYDSYADIEGPDWLTTQIVALDATMPPDTTKENFRQMLRNLIAARFSLKYHSDVRQTAGYALMVAKDGPKMTRSVVVPVPQGQGDNPPTIPRPTSRGPDGFPIMPPLPPAIASRPGGCIRLGLQDRSRFVCQWRTMQDLAETLEAALNSTVTEVTGLSGKYDFTLTFADHTESGGLVPSPSAGLPDGADPLPDIFSALQLQIGLKLERTKNGVQVMVIDHMLQTPTKN